MNKLIRAAGMLSLGTASLAVQTSVSAAEGGTKPWNVSAKLSGFYDDNINTRPNGPEKIDSFGFEVSPAVKYAINTEETKLKFGYTYSAKYYEGRDSNQWDQSHLINAELKHSFSPRVTLDLSDKFAVAQEPEQLGAFGLLRAKGDNISNRANAGATIGLTSLVGVGVGYRNSFFDYDDVAYKTALNRMEQEGSLDLRFQVQPSTVLIASYSYGVIDYDANFPNPNRDNTSHYLKVGVDQKFSPDLTASARVGAQIVDYDSAAYSDETSPYADLSVKYAFTPATSLMVGVNHQHNATDILDAQDQESTAVYGVLSHAITSMLTGRITAQYQNSEFNSNNAAIDGQTEDIFSLGLTLSYAVTENVAVEASYYYDKLNSPTVPFTSLQAREFSRNRVFLGVRFSY